MAIRVRDIQPLSIALSSGPKNGKRMLLVKGEVPGKKDPDPDREALIGQFQELKAKLITGGITSEELCLRMSKKLKKPCSMKGKSGGEEETPLDDMWADLEEQLQALPEEEAKSLLDDLSHWDGDEATVSGEAEEKAKRVPPKKEPEGEESEDEEEAPEEEESEDEEEPKEEQPEKKPKKGMKFGGKKMMAAKTLLTLLEEKASSLLDGDDALQAIYLHRVVKDLRSSLPEGGFVVLDDEVEAPDLPEVLYLSSLASMNDENACSAVANALTVPNVVAEAAPEPVAKALTVSDEEEDVKEEEDTMGRIVDSFAQVVKSTVRNEQLKRSDKLGVVQDAFDSLAKAIVPFVEATTPETESDVIHQVKSLVDEQMAPMRELLEQMKESLAQRSEETYTEPIIPVSKSIRARGSAPRTRVPGQPYKISEIVANSMNPGVRLY